MPLTEVPPSYLDRYYTVPDEDRERWICRGLFENTKYGCVVVVAVINPGHDWAAYIGAAPPDLPEPMAMKVVAQTGNKITDGMILTAFFSDLTVILPNIGMSYRK